MSIEEPPATQLIEAHERLEVMEVEISRLQEEIGRKNSQETCDDDRGIFWSENMKCEYNEMANPEEREAFKSSLQETQIIRKMSNSSNENPKTFPLEILLPKKETQQELFPKNHPEYDGLDTIIAILDTGVDPSLPGLQKTTTGERKIIDCVDCSGAGDVDTSSVVSAVDGVVEGLTGRKLKIPSTWQNPSGKYHLGIKPIYDLYSKALRATISRERQQEVFDPSHKMASADALRQMAKHKETLGGTSEKLEDKLDREDYASQIEFLKLMKAAPDAGPVADCLVWNDGIEWRACVDTSFCGRLGLCTPMGAFKKTGEFSKLTDRDEATYSFRIDEKNGNWLQIVVANGAHGSHVANIAAAYYADEPKKNGFAPGAKIVSFCIGDNRLDAMETGTAMTRAFNMCADYGVHVANMSFGETSHLPNKGRVIEELHKVSCKGNVVFTISGGNNGPALSTVGAPGGTSSGVIGVSTYLTPEMADPLYGVFNKVEGNLYPWSSRGPSTDDWLGVYLCAPGAALTGVPKYTRQSGQMMNGTSMSSPNAPGAVACLLSGLKATDQPWTSHQVRVALENTAGTIEGLQKLAKGQGLVQIDNAFNYLRKVGSEFIPRTLTNFSATVAGSGKRGVYLREHDEVNAKKEFAINIQPKFLEFSDSTKQIDFEKHMLLQCDASWISTPETFTSTATPRSFFLEVDPTQIKKGTVAYAEVTGIDSEAPHLGALFRFPITVVRPNSVGKSSDFAIQYKYDAPSGEPVRRFVTAPEHAKIVEVKVTSLSKVPDDRFMFHKLYLDGDICYRNTESHAMLGPANHVWTHYLPVKAGRTVELCLARAWSRGETPAKIQMKVKFHGVERPDNIVLVHGSGSSRVPFALSSYRPQEIKPEIKLNALTMPLKSTTQKIEPIGPGDIFMNGTQIHRLLLTYKLNVLKTTDLRLELPGLCDYLYESPLDCVLMQIFNSTKGYIAGGSTFPDRYTHKLEKGEYIIQAQLRHPDQAVLENVRDVPLHVITKIASPIALESYTLPVGPITGESSAKKFSKKTASVQQSVYFGSLPDDKIPKTIAVGSGCFMSGNFTVFADSNLSQVDKAKVTYNFSEYSTRPSEAISMITSKEKEVKKEQKVEMADAIRDLQISWLEKLTDETESNKLYNELIEKHPTHLPLLLTKMKTLLAKKGRSTVESDIFNMRIQQVLDSCNRNEVLQYLGYRQEYNEEQLGSKKTMDEKKDAIVDALIAKATLLADGHLAISTLEVPSVFKNGLTGATELKKADPLTEKELTTSDIRTAESTKTADEPTAVKSTNGNSTVEKKKVARKDFDAAYAEALKWIPADDTKMLLLSAKHAVAHGHKGRALKYLQKSIDEGQGAGKDTNLAETAVNEICQHLGWEHIANQLKNQTLVRHMSKFRPFQGSF